MIRLAEATRDQLSNLISIKSREFINKPESLLSNVKVSGLSAGTYEGVALSGEIKRNVRMSEAPSIQVKVILTDFRAQFHVFISIPRTSTFMERGAKIEPEAHPLDAATPEQLLYLEHMMVGAADVLGELIAPNVDFYNELIRYGSFRTSMPLP